MKDLITLILFIVMCVLALPSLVFGYLTTLVYAGVMKLYGSDWRKSRLLITLSLKRIDVVPDEPEPLDDGVRLKKPGAESHEIEFDPSHLIYPIHRKESLK